MEFQTVHPLKIFDLAKSQGRFVHVSAPMVRYSKLAFRQTVFEYGTDICWTPMIVAKEFNRNRFARDSDLSLSTIGPQPPTIVQFGANSPLEFSRAASMAAPFVSGVDLNCGCPQGWACAATLGAALMDHRELVRDMVVEARRRLREDGWAVGLDADMHSAKGRSVSVKIRVHKDLRKTIDFIDTVLGPDQQRHIDFLTIHPRTRRTPSSEAISVEALELLTSKYGDRVPILVSGDVFTLNHLPYTSPLLNRQDGRTTSPVPTWQPPPTNGDHHAATTTFFHEIPDKPIPWKTDPLPPPPPSSDPPVLPILPKLAGLMSARALLANPALYAGHDTCPWAAVELFMNKVARAPMPLKLVQHHIGEMCGPGLGPDKRPLLRKRERIEMLDCRNMCDLIDFLDEKMGAYAEGRSGGGMRRIGDAGVDGEKG